MARRGYDPRYEYNQGYAAGDALVQLSQLLRQGIGDYQQIGQNEAASKQKQDEYLLRLQQMLGQQEDRALTRKLGEDTLAMNRATREQQAAERASTAQTAAAKRSGLFKALTMPGEVTTESAPPPAFAGDPERLQPNILQALVKRPRRLEESTEGMTPDEAGNADVVEALMKRFLPKEPKEPKFSQGAMGVMNQRTGEITTP